MRAESNIQPVSMFEVNELPGGMTEIRFYENIESFSVDETERFSYDTYSVIVPSRETLEADVEENYSGWIDYAKAREESTPEPSASEQIAALCAENEQLRRENEITANALDELICVVLGGEV